MSHVSWLLANITVTYCIETMDSIPISVQAALYSVCLCLAKPISTVSSIWSDWKILVYYRRYVIIILLYNGPYTFYSYSYWTRFINGSESIREDLKYFINAAATITTIHFCFLLVFTSFEVVYLSLWFKTSLRMQVSEWNYCCMSAFNI